MNAPRNRNQALARVLVEELALAGLRHACIAPGSRSTPLALAFHDEERIRIWTHLDERSMAFLALGMAKSLREPVAILSTSGTAAANFHPAVAEAFHGRVPLLVLTADRPPEVEGWGAPQTMAQTGLYGPFAKWSVTLPPPEVRPELIRHARAAACRAFAEAAETPAGPVHLNVPFRKPLHPVHVPEDFAAHAWEEERHGREAGRPFVRSRRCPRRPDPSDVSRLAEELREVEKGVVLAGPCEAYAWDREFAAAVTELASRLGYPVLSDPLSQLRAGSHPKDLIVDSHDVFLRDEAVAHALRPDAVVRLGGVPSSNALMAYLQENREARQVLVDPGPWRDPFHSSWDVIPSEEKLFCTDLAGALQRGARRTAWTDLVARVASAAREAVDGHAVGLEGLFEGRVFSEIARALPDGATLFAASSMPVRDMDDFLPMSQKRIACLGNRGVNGIDGLVSTALGAAAHRGPLVAVLGDQAFYHDMNGLLAAKRHGIRAVFVVINNDGGGIFSFLPSVGDEETFERLFAMPHGLTFGAAAELYGLGYTRVASWEGFRTALDGALDAPASWVIEVPGDRGANRRRHEEVWAAGAAAARGVVGA